jgi:glutaredoxin
MKMGEAMKVVVTGLLLMLAAGVVQAQQIYRWVDANGRVQYGEKPPAGAPSNTLQPRVSSVGGNAAAAAKGAGAQPAAAKAAVKMFATDWCGYCRQARQYFARNGIAYTELDIEKSQAAMAEYKSLGGRGVPVILVGSERMNGYGEQRLAQMLKAGGH